MGFDIRQQAGNTEGAGRSVPCSVTLSQTTTPNSQHFLAAAVTHPRENGSALPHDPPGYSRLFTRKEDKLTVAAWQRTSAPATSRVTVQSSGETYGLQVQFVEATGVALANAVDKVKVGGDNPEGQPGSSNPYSGATGTTAQADELVFGIVANRYASTYQFGFTGGLGQRSQSLSDGGEPDHDRTRMTILAGVATQVGSYAVGARLTSNRDWVAAIITFRGASTGPVKFTSKLQPPGIKLSGRARLTVSGPLRSKQQPAGIRLTGRAWMGPFEKQMQFGRQGLVIGEGTPYRIQRIVGLGGWDVRSSDSPFPRGDGDRRGIDLMTARQVLVEVNFDDDVEPVEQGMQRLLAALRPRRTDDFDAYFRLPGMPLQVLRSRPGPLSREIDADQLLLTEQTFLLRAADPRIYSARRREVVVPVTVGTGPTVIAVSVPNIGNGDAYPLIQVRGAPDVQVTGLALVNVTGNIAFEFSGLLPPGGQLVADMEAAVTDAPRQKITVDGQGKYGAWVSPREPFFIAPDPDAPGGINAVYLRTTPPGAGVTCQLSYRDTWVG